MTCATPELHKTPEAGWMVLDRNKGSYTWTVIRRNMKESNGTELELKWSDMNRLTCGMKSVEQHRGNGVE